MQPHAFPNFNSIKVQLEQKAPAEKIDSDYDFNSIKVQLEPSYLSMPVSFPVNFNSIKVQLEPGTGWAAYNIYKFQFHKGTIRTYVWGQ